jgi:hypothetical protein
MAIPMIRVLPVTRAICPSSAGGDRSGGDRHDTTLDIERLDINPLDVDA